MPSSPHCYIKQDQLIFFRHVKIFDELKIYTYFFSNKGEYFSIFFKRLFLQIISIVNKGMKKKIFFFVNWLGFKSLKKDKLTIEKIFNKLK